MTPLVVLLVDNAHAPDRRTVWISSILRRAGAHVRVVAWDRRVEPPALPDPQPPYGEEVVRIAAPAAWGAGRGTVAAMTRFWARVVGRRAELITGADALIAADLYLLPLGRALTQRTGVPLLYDAREDWAALEAGRRPRAIRAAVARAETALARGAAGVIVPGESRASRWRRVAIEPIVLRNVGTTAPRAVEATRWDVAFAGLLAEQRRSDLVLELAARRSDLRFVVTGAGRLEREVRARAVELPNVDFLGFVEDVDGVLAASSVIVYGEDPCSAYSALACPNTLYQAVRVRRPLIYYCGGEPEQASQQFRIGIRCRPEVSALSAAVDAAQSARDWEFDAAWEWLRNGAEDAFLARVTDLVPELRQ